MKTKKFVLFTLITLLFVVTACMPAAPANVQREEPAAEQSTADDGPSRINEAPSAGEVKSENPLAEMPAAEEPAAEEPASAPPAPSTNQDSASNKGEGDPQRIDSLPSPQPTQMPVSEEEFYEEPFEENLPYWDNQFQDYGVNPFIHTERDHLSTFGLDVDTGSYTMMRSYLNEGSLPPFDAIRVEEFVNYFDPGYENNRNDTFAIYADGAENPFTDEGTYFLRFGIQGYEVEEWERKPANLTFVIDVSGSMAMDNRLGLVKQSLEYLLEKLGPDDQVAIVIFGSRAKVHLRPTPGDHERTINNAIRSLQTGGSTNAEAGLTQGYKWALSMYDPNAINRVILCSDGVANVGMTGPNGILSQVQRYVDQGIYLTTVGFGMGNYNDTLMEQLADNGDGFYAYVDDLAEAKKLFVDEITSTLQVIAKDAKVQVDFNPDVVESYRLVGYENRDVADEDFRNDDVDAGELGAGHHAVALYEVALYRGAEGRMATVQLRWENPDTGEIRETNGNFNTWDLAERFEDTADRYQLAVVAMQFAEVLRESPWAWDVDLHDLGNLADQLAKRMRRDYDVVELSDLIYEAEQLMDYGW